MKCIYSSKHLPVLISFLFLSCFASVHAETISGIIVDEKTNKPVDNVVVVAHASHSEKMSLSNMQGSFTRFCVSNLFAKDSQSTNYFLDNRYHSTMQSKGPELLLSLKFKFGKGQKVTDEYRGYNPNVERFQ